MNKHLFSLFLFAAFGTLIGPADAGPVVAVGSTYSIYLEGGLSGDDFFGVTEFDDSPATALRSGKTLTLSESEVSLGGGVSRISIHLVASADLFPALGETAILAIGVGGNGLDLLRQVSLDGALITFFDSSNKILLTSDNLVGQVPQGNPWTGFLPDPTNALGIVDVGGLGVSRVTFDFTVTDIGSEVPEPGSLLLGGIAIVGVIAARRRRSTVGHYGR
jgi:hypothetical protein